MTGLAERTGGSVPAVQREVSRLERAGVLRSRRVGGTRLVSAAPDSPYEPELSGLVRKVFGPAAIIGELLDGLPGVEAAFIYGSWAERYQGTEGPPPTDIDVLVVGGADRDEIDRVARDAGHRLGRPVDILLRSRERWAHGDDGFAQTVRAGPLVPVPLVRGHG